MKAGELSRNRSVWAVIAVLIVLLAAGAIAAGSGKSTTNVNSGMRAVIVPTTDTARTVIVPPCGTGVNVASTNAAAIAATTGSTTVELPVGTGIRIVLVPSCTEGGAASGPTGLPSALFVAKPGTPVPHAALSAGSTKVADPSGVRSQLIVPPGSAIRTVVVPACGGKSTGPAESILGARGSTALAPSC